MQPCITNYIFCLVSYSLSLTAAIYMKWRAVCSLQRGYDAGLLPGIFSQAVIGNSLVAILSGLVAQVSADSLGYT